MKLSYYYGDMSRVIEVCNELNYVIMVVDVSFLTDFLYLPPPYWKHLLQIKYKDDANV